MSAAMTELPTVEAGCGRPAERHPWMVACRRSASIFATGHGSALSERPSTAATTSQHSFSGLAKFFLPGKPALAALEAELFRRLGCRNVFDDEYISSGGQLHELITGRDRFVADLRPLVRRRTPSPAIPTTCAPPCCSTRSVEW